MSQGNDSGTNPTPLEISQAWFAPEEDPRANRPPSPKAPGDEVPPTAPGSAEKARCRLCGGRGRTATADAPCPACAATGHVQVGFDGG